MGWGWGQFNAWLTPNEKDIHNNANHYFSPGFMQNLTLYFHLIFIVFMSTMAYFPGLSWYKAKILNCCGMLNIFEDMSR